MKLLELALTNLILKNKTYQQEMDALRVLEQDRIFCRHDLEHCLSVARITMLLCMEHGMTADADLIYASALLHDIGRTAEYRQGIAHQTAGRELSEQILKEIGCTDVQKLQILQLIGSHRQPAEDEASLEYLFYLADKRSRLCFACPAQGACNWSKEKRTMQIKE